MKQESSWYLAPCPPPSEVHRKAAEARQNELTKPPGSLGRLEHIAITLAALQRTDQPSADQTAIVLFAGDHGITAQGISAFPSAVTVEMLKNFANGGAAISVLARTHQVPLVVVDAGTLATAPIPGVMTDKCRNGTDDFSKTPALSDADLEFALACGARTVQAQCETARDIIIFGEMGIGNTTSATAIAAALIGCPPRDIVGAGTGMDSKGQQHKAQVISAALSKHNLDTGAPAPKNILSSVGGLEIAALTGAIITAGQNNIPVLIDGFIVSVAALAAVRLNPSVRPWLLFSHRSEERGHKTVLEALDAEPLLDLNLRLGEGSGAAIALPLVRNACALHNNMATFAEAAVSDGS